MGGNGKRVFVGNLPRGCRERDVERFFRGYGRVVEVLMKKGYCFVEFDDPRDADDAVYDLNGKDLMGERLSVEVAKGTPRTFRDDRRDDRRGPRGGHRGGFRRGSPMRDRERRRDDKYGPPVRTEYRLVVENLSSRVSWQDLKDYMRTAGEVTYADAHKGNKNEGVIEFASYKDMKNAIDKLDDTELNGRRIRLVEDKSAGRRSSRSRSRSRSRRRSRSRSASRSRSRTPKRSVSRDRASRSAERDRSRSRSPIRDDKERSRSRSRDRRSRSRSESRGRSRSNDRNGDMDQD